MQSKTKPKVVLDSVILVSAFLTKGLASELPALCAARSEPYTAEEILQEVHDVLLEKEHILRTYRGIRIVPPEDFVHHLRGNKKP